MGEFSDINGQFEFLERKATDPSAFRAGHRRRIKDRFMSAGAEAMPDYEILELILFMAKPRSDVKPLAHHLLQEFKTFHGVLSAEAVQLKRIEGVGDGVVETLKIVEAAGQRLAKSTLGKREVISSWDQLIAYCRTQLAHKEIESFRVLFLDRKNQLIADHELAQGTVDHVPVYPREVIKRALELNASAFILVHNHPSGDPTPSEADIHMTAQIQQAAEAMNIRLHDHIIVGKASVTSLHELGYC